MIDANVAKLRQRIAEEKSKGKTIGFLSIPLSTAGGGYFNVNKEIVAQAKARIEQRFGANSLWILNPGAEQARLPLGQRRRLHVDVDANPRGRARAGRRF